MCGLTGKIMNRMVSNVEGGGGEMGQKWEFGEEEKPDKSK